MEARRIESFVANLVIGTYCVRLTQYRRWYCHQHCQHPSSVGFIRVADDVVCILFLVGLIVTFDVAVVVLNKDGVRCSLPKPFESPQCVLQVASCRGPTFMTITTSMMLSNPMNPSLSAHLQQSFLTAGLYLLRRLQNVIFISSRVVLPFCYFACVYGSVCVFAHACVRASLRVC